MERAKNRLTSQVHPRLCSNAYWERAIFSLLYCCSPCRPVKPAVESECDRKKLNWRYLRFKVKESAGGNRSVVLVGFAGWSRIFRFCDGVVSARIDAMAIVRFFVWLRWVNSCEI